jgi:trimeric autotransporter adhesin
VKLLHQIVGMMVLGVTGCGGGGDNGTTPNPTPTQTLSTIRLASSAVSLTAGNTASLAPVALDASGRTIAGAAGYTYSSSAPAVAEAQSSGAVLGIGAGTATVTVSLTRDGVTATSAATITVSGTLPPVATVVAGNADQTFAPPTVVVARNASVTYSFGALQHNVTFRSAAGAPANIANSTNTTAARVFPTAGDFTFDCSLHAGMTGTVVVR